MMSVCTYSLLRRMCVVSGRRTSATAVAQQVQTVETESFRTAESHPENHDTRHLSRLYTVPSDIYELFHSNITNEWKKQIKIFAEFGILVRKPAVDLISYLENTDYTKPINKYVLYGIEGVGKTTTLIHLIHYGLEKKFIVFHVPWVNNWFRFPKEIADSVFQPGKIDLPIHAGQWLKYFRTLNETHLSQLNLTTSKEYVWNQRESTQCGTPLLGLIEFGIQRIKFACGIIDALVEELKAASTAGKCRTLVVMDGFNAFTSNITGIRDDMKVYVPAERISLTKTFMNTTNYNWCNGAAILTVDTKANKDKRESVYPRYLLGKEGFESLDPFLPVLVENYNTAEFNSIIDYYKDRKWIRSITPEGQREIELLSNRNPLTCWTYCTPL